uniref:Uncharacterized protein n=1 Tax=Anguilla anguilla TaxID=7936 RepID=A0A0E9U387_ANGAN
MYPAEVVFPGAVERPWWKHSSSQGSLPHCSRSAQDQFTISSRSALVV